MTLKYYVPLSIGFFVLVLAVVHEFSLPVLPFALILLAGETLLGFNLENERIPRFLAWFFTPGKRRSAR